MIMRFAMRLSEELLDGVGQVIGNPVGEIFEGTPYVLITQTSDKEFNFRFVSEEEMVAEYMKDSSLHILS